MEECIGGRGVTCEQKARAFPIGEVLKKIKKPGKKEPKQ